jgi:glycosyltransferase involved in cell wall biosynthesis
VVVVTLDNHDIGEYLEDGVSAVFAKNNPKDCVDKIVDLFYDYQKAVRIGQAGKEAARKHFSPENFQAQWTALLTKRLGL